MIGDNYLIKIKIQDKTLLKTIVQLTCGILAKLKMNTLKYGGAPGKAHWPSEHYCLQVIVHTLAVHQAKACWPCGHCNIQVGHCPQSVLSLGLLSAVSMSSSLLLSSDNSSLASSKAGVGAWAHTFKANARLEVTAGDPTDMGLSEQELCPDPLAPRPIPGSAKLLTGNPGTRLSNVFSPTIMGDIGAGNPRRATSKGGIVGDISLKCGSVLGPAAPVVVSGEELGWKSNGWLDWDPNASGSNMELASNSSSNAEFRSASCLGLLYSLG